MTQQQLKVIYLSGPEVSVSLPFFQSVKYFVCKIKMTARDDARS